MSKKVSSKTLRRLTFQEIIKLREITDGTHNPYVYAKWIPEKDVEGLVAELKKKAKWRLEEKMSTEMEGETSVTRFRPRRYVRLDEVLAKLRAEEQKKET